MINYKSWCRLCGSFDDCEVVDPEITDIIQNVFDIHPETAFLCQNCHCYVRDFDSFLTKSRILKEMFQELDYRDSSIGCDIDFVINVRQFYDLPLPDIEIVKPPDPELAQNIADIEAFQFEEDDSDRNDSPMIQRIDHENDDYEDEECKFEYEELDIAAAEEEPNEAEQPTDAEGDEISKHFLFKCHVCDKDFHKMFFLATHTRNVHGCLPQVLCVCGSTVGLTKNLIEHWKSCLKRDESDFRSCLECRKTFLTITQYNNHMTSVHSSDPPKFTCECGKTFKQSHHFTVHAKTHLPDDIKYIHKCEICSKNYSTIFSLRHHIRHIHEKRPNFQCSYCEKTFSRKANLDSHLISHTTERKFECDLCHMMMKTKQNLRMHKKTHSTNPEDFYLCELCNRLFKTHNQLTNHMVSHTTEKKFKCSQCPSEYKRSKELVTHTVSAHTGETRFACNWCPKAFLSNSSFRRHKLRTHPEELKAIEIGIILGDEQGSVKDLETDANVKLLEEFTRGVMSKMEKVALKEKEDFMKSLQTVMERRPDLAEKVLAGNIKG